MLWFLVRCREVHIYNDGQDTPRATQQPTTMHVLHHDAAALFACLYVCLRWQQHQSKNVLDGCVFHNCSTVQLPCKYCCAGASTDGISKKQKPASRSSPAVQGDRATAKSRAVAGSFNNQAPADNGQATALVLHESAVQPESQVCAARAAARSPATCAGNALAVMPNANRHAALLRQQANRRAAILQQQAEVAENLPNLIKDAEEYKVGLHYHHYRLCLGP